MNSRVQSAVLVAALVIGTALRLFHLGLESVWFDEAYSIQLAKGSIGHILLERWTDIHPPLYYLSLHFWMPLVGEGEAPVRLLSALCDIAMLPVAGLAARRLFGSGVAVLTVVLLAVSPFHVQYSQEARMYALLCLLSTVSMLSFLSFFERPHRGWRAVYIASTTLMLYTHIYSVFIVAAQMLTLAIVWRRHADTFRKAVRPWFFSSMLILAFYSPWLVSLIDQVSRVQGAFWISHPLLIAVLHPLIACTPDSFPLALVLVPLWLFGLSEMRRERPSSETGLSPGAVVVPWLLTSTVLPFVLSEIGSPIFLPKYTIAASVPFTMLAALGLTRVRGFAWRPVLLASVAVLAVWHFSAYYTVPKKDGWRRAATTLEGVAQPGDVVLFYPWFNQIPFDYYHRREDLTRLPLVPDLQTPLPAANAVPALVKQAIETRRRVWLVVQQGISQRSLIVSELSRLMTPAEHLSAEHVELFLFERPR